MSEQRLDLTEHELEEAEQRSSVRAHVLYEAVRMEGNEELKRPASALAWSGLAAGLSMGFSLVAEGLLRAYLPDAPWRDVVAKLGYSIGFLLVVMGRQQLFTESTLTAVLPVLHEPKPQAFLNMLRLWVIVLAANICGALLFAWIAAATELFRPEVKQAFHDIGGVALHVTFWQAFLRSIFAGWLIAVMVWLLPFAEGARIWVIMILTWIVGLAHFPHIVAGSVAALYAVNVGEASWGFYLAGYFLPTLLGNIVGGAALVAALNHAQVFAGQEE